MGQDGNGAMPGPPHGQSSPPRHARWHGIPILPRDSLYMDSRHDWHSDALGGGEGGNEKAGICLSHLLGISASNIRKVG